MREEEDHCTESWTYLFIVTFNLKGDLDCVGDVEKIELEMGELTNNQQQQQHSMMIQQEEEEEKEN